MNTINIAEKTNNDLHLNSDESELLRLDGVSVKYTSEPVLSNVSFCLKKGEIGCILGPSGSGKTSLLRAIAGFMSVSNGSISINQQLVSGQNTELTPNQRSVGVVFQDFALFPHMTVSENIAFGLHKLSKTEQAQRVAQYMQITGIAPLANTYPAQLSGGQQQRVAIARALVVQPQLLLMDEAFSSLDPSLREQIAQDIRKIIKSLGLTALLVTHDQTEAFSFADKIAVVANNHLQQFSDAYTLYHEPQNYFVAQFIGEGTFIAGTLICQDKVMSIDTSLGCLSISSEQIARLSLQENQQVKVLLRPDDVIHDDTSVNKAIIADRHFRGAFIRYQLQLSKTKEMILCFAPSHHNHEIGEEFGIRLKIEHVICFPQTAN